MQAGQLAGSASSRLNYQPDELEPPFQYHPASLKNPDDGKMSAIW
jgi:hypothetical protein